MIGEHSVVFIPDPDAQAWGPILNSNPSMTTDIVGWGPAPFSPEWSWQAPGVAVGGLWLTRDENHPIAKGAATLFQLRVRFTVAAPGQIDGGLYFGDTALAARTGPFWSGGSHAIQAIGSMSAPTPGAYLFDFTYDPGDVPGAFTFVGPTIYFHEGQAPVIDSVELRGQGSESIDLSCLVDEVSIHHGRDDTDSQPDASSATIGISLDTDLDDFPPAIEIGGIIRVTTTIPGASSTRFVGRITDLVQGWDDAGEDTPNRPIVQVIATSFLAELGRRVVGDAPWPQQLDGARVAAVLAAGGFVLDPITSDPGTVQILPRDVDSQPALDVARGTAESAGGLVWATRNGDIRYADADHRRGGSTSLALDACDVLVTPSWRRTTEGLVNVVSIGYGVPAEEGGDQPRYTAQRDDSIERFGTYGFSATTELAQLADAAAMGQLLLVRNRVPVWVMAALPIDVAGLDEARTNALLNLDMHNLVSLTGLPVAGNVPTSALLWVEGWTEHLAWGEHEIELVVSGYCRTSPAPRWNDVGENATWDNQSPTLTWDDATCLGPLPSSGRWDDVPASNRWDSNPFTITWDTWPG